MKATLLSGLALLSAQFTLIPEARANSAALVPVQQWPLQIAAAGQACNISNSFSKLVSLRLHSNKGDLKSLFLRLESAALDAAKPYILEISGSSGAALTFPAKALSTKELFIALPEGNGLSALLSASSIITLKVDGQNYVLSLKGLAAIMPQLLSCQADGQAEVKAEITKPAVQVQQAVVPQDTKSTQLSDPELPSLKINPFPFDPEKNKAALKGLEQRQNNEERLASENEVIVPAPAVQTSSQTSVPTIPTVPTVIPPQAVQAVELEKTTPQSDVRFDPPEPEVTQLAHAEDAEDKVQSSVNLIRPPVMDLPLPSVEDQGKMTEQDIEIAQENGVVSAPDGVIVNSDAQLYVTQSKDERVLEKNDLAEEQDAFARPVGRGEAGLLSQTYEMAAVEPVIIPSIPEVELPTRFDLMNRGEAITSGSKTPSEPLRQVRDVSNQMLEEQLKTVLSVEPKSMVESKPKNSQVQEEPQKPVKQEVQPPATHEAQSPVTQMAKPAAPSGQTKDGGAQWIAPAGSNLRTILADWSVRADVELIWDTQEQFQLLSKIRFNGSYEHAVSSVLNQYIGTPKQKPRPHGDLYIDPQSERRVLIIQSALLP